RCLDGVALTRPGAVQEVVVAALERCVAALKRTTYHRHDAWPLRWYGLVANEVHAVDHRHDLTRGQSVVDVPLSDTIHTGHAEAQRLLAGRVLGGQRNGQRASFEEAHDTIHA